jgi:hypothetical protein
MKTDNKKSVKNTPVNKVRFSIEMTIEDKERYDVLKNEFDCNVLQLMQYLMSLEKSKLDKGSSLVENKLKQWLYLGYKKEITTHGLRMADYGTGNIMGLRTVKPVFDLYKSEIEEFNKNIINEKKLKNE